jgi:hypothetical protein
MNPRMHIDSEMRKTVVSFDRSRRGVVTGSSRIVDVEPSSGVRSVGWRARPLPLSMRCASGSSMAKVGEAKHEAQA